MQARMKQNIRVASQKERMLRKLEQRRKERAEAESRQKTQDQQYQHMVFRGDEPVEKSSRKTNKKKRKKKKKKKN